MSREELLGLTSDVNRLLAAGATAASRHEGLSRRAHTLRELSRKVTALTPVADAVERVVNSTPRQAGVAFLDLVTITRQIQGSLVGAGVDGSLQPIEASGPWQTSVPVRDIVSAHETLTGHVPDRVQAIRNLAKQPLTGEVRLLSAVMHLLDDNGTAIGEWMADEILPTLGRAVLSELTNSLDFNGVGGAMRRLRAICHIDPKTGAKLCRQALQEGTTALKIQALRCLPQVGKAGEAEQAGLRWCRHEQNAIRLAALDTLSESVRDDVLELLLELIRTDGVIAQHVVKLLANLPHPRTSLRLRQELEGARQASSTGKQKTAAKRTAKRLLKALAQRSDSAALEAAAAWVEDKDLWKDAVPAAWKLPEPKRYERLAPLCADLSHPREDGRKQGKLLMKLFNQEDDSDTPRTDWDPRWGNILLPHLEGSNRQETAVALTVVWGAKAIPDLLRVLVASVKKNECHVVSRLGKLRVREAIAPLIQLMPGQPAYHHCIHEALLKIGDAAAIPLLQKLAAKTRNRDRRQKIQKVIKDLEKAQADK